MRDLAQGAIETNRKGTAGPFRCQAPAGGAGGSPRTRLSVDPGPARNYRVIVTSEPSNPGGLSLSLVGVARSSRRSQRLRRQRPGVGSCVQLVQQHLVDLRQLELATARRGKALGGFSIARSGAPGDRPRPLQR